MGPARGWSIVIAAGLKGWTEHSAHQSRNSGLAWFRAAINSANRGSPVWRPAAMRNWLSTARAAGSHLFIRARLPASVNIIQIMLRRPAGIAGRVTADPYAGLVPYQVVEVAVVDRSGARRHSVDEPLEAGKRDLAR